MTRINLQQPKIVLLCGMLGITRMLWQEYFRGVRSMLQMQGFTVLIPQLPFAKRIETRARFLAEFLRHESGPLHLIAHSMGGVDARFYISRLHGHRKIASLTTLASPHHGSILADHEMATWYSPYRHLPALADLTLDAMAAFNAQTPDFDNVIYRSYSAARDVHELPWFTRRFGRRIEAAEGANDSQVSASSAIWGEHTATLNCDHFELIGMNIWLNPFASRKPFKHLPVYRAIGDWIHDFEETAGKA
ncbi:MAG: alpha/beta hydrolase [Mariprofundaceae bacterium]|nr:alpha/beta hydrolase [Mariprofundaceae bacterium]